MLQQTWVETWAGWKEIEKNQTDIVAMEAAEDFLRIAKANVPVQMTSNRRRLQELHDQGLRLRTALPNGNNCLIDSVLLGLMAAGVAPKQYTVGERRPLIKQCRDELHSQYGTPVGPFLDGHRDAPRILNYFLCRLWRADVSIRVQFYDRLSKEELGDAEDELTFVDFTSGQRLIYERHFLHIFTHLDDFGRGYHFDALCLSAGDSSFSQCSGKRKQDTDMEKHNSAVDMPEFSSCKRNHSSDMLPDTTPSDPAGPAWPNSSAASQSHGKVGPASEQPLPQHTRLSKALQAFFDRRQNSVTINANDVERIRANWFNTDQLAMQLHTLLQAGATYGDSGMHAARRLANEFRAFYAVACEQGPARPLREAPPFCVDCAATKETPENDRRNSDSASRNGALPAYDQTPARKAVGSSRTSGIPRSSRRRGSNPGTRRIYFGHVARNPR